MRACAQPGVVGMSWWSLATITRLIVRGEGATYSRPSQSRTSSEAESLRNCVRERSRECKKVEEVWWWRGLRTGWKRSLRTEQ
jgi:hypothetical protein